MTKYVITMITIWLSSMTITNVLLKRENSKLFKIAESFEKIILGATLAIFILWVIEYP